MRQSLAASVALCSLLVLAPGLVDGQVLEVDDARIEFLGLESWSPRAVVDSVSARDPDAGPGAYPMVLRELGFARAFATPIPGSDPPPVTLVSVVEAAREELVALRSGFGPPREIPSDWSALAEVSREEGPTFQTAVNLRWLRDSQGDLPAALSQRIGAPGREASIERVWAALDARDTAADLEAAVAILSRDGDAGNRTLAAAVASGFPEDDRAWRALMEALLDPSAPVTATSNQALGSMVVTRARPVDWAPSASALRSLLAGANLPAYPLVLQVLESTEVSPELADELLEGSGVLLLDHLGSRFSPQREAAHALLVRLRGDDLGTDPDPWEAWIADL